MRAGVVTPALVSGGVSETEGCIGDSYCYDRYDARMLRRQSVTTGEGALSQETSTQDRQEGSQRDRSGKSYLYFGVSRGMLGLCAASHRADPVVYHPGTRIPPNAAGHMLSCIAGAHNTIGNECKAPLGAILGPQNVGATVMRSRHAIM